MTIYAYVLLATPFVCMLIGFIILHYVDPVIPPKRPRR